MRSHSITDSFCITDIIHRQYSHFISKVHSLVLACSRRLLGGFGWGHILLRESWCFSSLLNHICFCQLSLSSSLYHNFSLSYTLQRASPHVVKCPSFFLIMLEKWSWALGALLSNEPLTALRLSCQNRETTSLLPLKPCYLCGEASRSCSIFKRI